MLDAVTKFAFDITPEHGPAYPVRFACPSCEALISTAVSLNQLAAAGISPTRLSRRRPCSAVPGMVRRNLACIPVLLKDHARH